MSNKIPPHSGQESVAAFKRDGFYVKRIDGDHAILYHRSRPLNRPVVIRLGKELSPFEVKNNLRTAGISREKYLDLLKKKKRRKKKARPRRGK